MSPSATALAPAAFDQPKPLASHDDRNSAASPDRQSSGIVSGPVDSSNLSYVESLYTQYQANPFDVEPAWRDYFQKLDLAMAQGTERTKSSNPFAPPSVGDGSVVSPAILDATILQERVDRLIRNYRIMGHFAAKLDPLGQPREEVRDLDPTSVGLTDSDMQRQFSTLSSAGKDVRTLAEILEWLRNTYCRSIGVQFMHIDEVQVREWLMQRMESTENRIQLDRDQQLRILKRLSDAADFEEFILKKFQGAKSFSLEGAETLIPLLEMAIDKAADAGVQEIVLGMAHRGRLNVLCNIMGKTARAIFREFADLDPELSMGRGDVKYHLGYSHDYYTRSGKKVHLSLCFNPSHLEFVNPVAMGRTRAKQDRANDTTNSSGLCLLIHGDAAFAGEGIIQETLNMSQLPASQVGGTIHVIVNNQVGFTTGPGQARSTTYATDVAKMLQIPIFHVNGEDPEAVAQVITLAMDFRQTFKRDVVIDMYCYRRRGHNEQDEPRFTQPHMYRFIDARQPVRDSYLKHLQAMGGVTQADADAIKAIHWQQLESEYRVATGPNFQANWSKIEGYWATYQGGADESVPDVETGVPIEKLAPLLEVQTRFPQGFQPHPKLEKILMTRAEMARGGKPLDWAAGEALAFASLLVEGHRVRLHGQDSERGTFSHRHSVLHDVNNDSTYTPLSHLAADQAEFQVYNSCLCEAGVVGYEYGYSLDFPEALVCWEAQFGDFVNVAQVIIDQFISSAEDKWNRLSGMVMLLPHGFEGAGPEHSSARIERFLNLCAEDNMQIAYPTTSAQLFHLLRRQVKRPWRKPLVVMTPKYFLRSPQSASPLTDFASGTFKRILRDALTGRPDSDVSRVLLCSGKVYFDLLKRREESGRNDIAILRVEQLYPLPTKELLAELNRYRPNVPVTWVQEEPSNMGSWWFILAHWGTSVLKANQLTCVSRPASASPATGSKHSHEIEQNALITEAFAT